MEENQLLIGGAHLVRFLKQVAQVRDVSKEGT